MCARPKPNPKVHEWQHALLLFTAALLLFETVTGLAIWLLPFSIANQFIVLLHTGLGLLFLAPFLWYQLRHWRIYRVMQMTHVKLTGYLALGATLLAIVSGLMLTGQAVFGTRISYTWRTLHVLSTIAILASVLPHVLLIVVRDVRARASAAIQPILQAQRRFGLGTPGEQLTCPTMLHLLQEVDVTHHDDAAPLPMHEAYRDVDRTLARLRSANLKLPSHPIKVTPQASRAT